MNTGLNAGAGRRPARPALRALVAAAWALLVAVAALPAQAHLMVAQHGTLNVVGSGAYLVLSLPAGAFRGVDDDGDGRLALAELRRHGRAIEQQVQAQVQLLGPHGPYPLRGLLLNLSPPDAAPGAPADQVVVMGRFDLQGAAGAADAADDLVLHMGLFGRDGDEQVHTVTVTRKPQAQRLVFTPSHPSHALFPPARAVVLSYLQLGAEHVLQGLDHVLFLLVVMSAGWRPRQLVAAITCFTAGHAVTLAGSLLAGWRAPPAVVEPAIAATIVGMVLFDAWARRRPQALPQGLRLLLVFGCALVHGLGLAGALGDQGLDPRHAGLSLAGFNAGVEAGQLAVAAAALAACGLLRRLCGAGREVLAVRVAPWAALSVGVVWLVQRVVEGA